MIRPILVVLDGCGAGEAPDAADFGDFDHPSTVKHVWETCGGLKAPHLEACGFFVACGVPETSPGLQGFSIEFGRLQPTSKGKDSVTGHWEMMGIVTKVPFPTYPNGFPADLVSSFEHAIGRKIIGNKAASGTVIIQELGDEHLRTGFPIVYTSADSVFQVACHEAVVPVEKLYDFCQIAREICTIPNNVERIIARPFEGTSGAFTRTERRRDFPLSPPPNIIDDIVKSTGNLVAGVGVIPELFDHRGFLPLPRTTNNQDHAVELLKVIGSSAPFIFANFEDFDMLYGHRNNPNGFGKALEAFDSILGSILENMGENDLLMLTADHGNDPTTPSTDHSREYVPWVRISKSQKSAVTSMGDQIGLNQIAKLIGNDLGLVK